MGDKIEAANLSAMVNEVLSEFMGNVVEYLLADPGIERASGEELNADLQTFRSMIRKKEFPLGNTLKEIDKAVDRFWRGSRNQLKLSCENPDETVRNAALAIWPVFEDLPNPTTKNYDLQYGRLTILLSKLDQIGEEKLRDALVITWINALREGVNEFHALKQEKTKADSLQETGASKRARDQLCETYLKIVDRLNAMIILHPDDAHAALNATINQAVQNRKISQKLSKKKKSAGDKGDEGVDKKPKEEPEVIEAELEVMDDEE